MKKNSSFINTFMKTSNFIILAGFIALLSSCMPMGDQSVNKELFQGKEDLKLHVAALKPGMSEEAVFKQLNIPKEKFVYMSTYEVQANVYGNSMAQGSLEELERFKRKMMSYKGYYLPYREISSNGSLGFGTLNVNKKGYDLKLIIIFENDRLVVSSVTGAQDVNTTDDQFMWNTILKKSTGIGF